MDGLEARLKRLESFIRTGWKSYEVSAESDLRHISTPEGLIFLNTPELIELLEEQIANMNPPGKYVIIVDDIPSK